MSAHTNDPFFPSIHDAAEHIDLATLGESDAAGVIDRNGGQEESPLQEVDSLCMTCGEQVADPPRRVFMQAYTRTRGAPGYF